MDQVEDDKAPILQVYGSMYQGMLERDVELLDRLLNDQYTLTHMTGHLLTKREWMQQIRSGEMQYRSSQERHAMVELDGDQAVLVGQNVVDANIWDSRGTWNPAADHH